jgi:hypothetical protein
VTYTPPPTQQSYRHFRLFCISERLWCLAIAKGDEAGKKWVPVLLGQPTNAIRFATYSSEDSTVGTYLSKSIHAELKNKQRRVASIT